MKLFRAEFECFRIEVITVLTKILVEFDIQKIRLISRLRENRQNAFLLEYTVIVLLMSY